MSGLRPPPKREGPSRVLARFLFLLVLFVGLGVVVWAAVVIQQIPLVEDVALEDVETEDIEVVDGIRINISDRGESPTPTFLLHDIDVTGSAMLTSVVEALGDDVRTVAVDLVGFGLSTRLPGKSVGHTVADMARTLSQVVDTRSDGRAVLVGVGLGAEVAAEIAVTNPGLVAGLVMIDVDFYDDGGWVQSFEKIPWLGLAVTHAFESRGLFSDTTWAPYCDQGGWCPTPGQQRARDLATSIKGTAVSLHGFRNTPPASDVPSRLGDVTAPTILIWSRKGNVPQDSIDRVIGAMSDVSLEEIDAYQAHLEAPEKVAVLIRQLLP